MAQKIFRFIIRLLFPLFADFDIRGYEHLPKEGGFVVASNHLGRLDPAMLYYAIDHGQFALPVAEKYKTHPFFGPLGNWMNVIWLDRFNPDLAAIREVINRMKKGQALVIAPEGTRSKTEALLEGKPGVAFLASKANVPIMPIAMWGTEDRLIIENMKRFRRSKIIIRGGPTFMLKIDRSKDRDVALREATDEIMCRIALMLPEQYHGFYANHPRLKELQLEAESHS